MCHCLGEGGAGHASDGPVEARALAERSREWSGERTLVGEAVRKAPRPGRAVRFETVAADPVTANGVTVTPLARTLTVRTRFGTLVWNRPVAVRVERGGQVERIRIVDVTRAVRVGLLVSGVVAAAALAALVRRKE